MSDLVSELIFLFSALSAIFVMVMIIAKERRKQKVIDLQKKKTFHNKLEMLSLD